MGKNRTPIAMKSLSRGHLLCFLLLLYGLLAAQTGPNSPATSTNNTSTGSIAWTNPGNAVSSNNAYATVTSKGINNYISTSGYGFSISIPSSIAGIVVEVERSTLSPTAVAVLNTWSNGNTKAISAGVARCLVAAVFMENGLGARDVTAMTYGGQAMTQITEATVGGAAFTGKIEYWRLMESGIASATSTAFSLTFNGTALDQNWEAISSAVYQFVDQVNPVSATAALSSNAATNPITLSPALSTFEGGFSISGVFCGNNTTPASAINGSNTYLINSGFTEVIDTYSANSGFATSGGAFQVAHKATVTSGSEAPSYTFAGTANRQVACCIHLQRLRECDQTVRLLKAGVITGNNYAQSGSAWTTTDTYTTYGGATDLWGTTWTETEVNASNFGAVFSASVQNGTARVDHMRITIYSFSTLPIRLLEFFGYYKPNGNALYWRCASEQRNSHFEIERCGSDLQFRPIGTVDSKGDSQVISDYEFLDPTPLPGINYYRLKQVDEDGKVNLYKTISLSQWASSSEPLLYPNPYCGGDLHLGSDANQSEWVDLYDNSLRFIRRVKPDEGSINPALEQLAEGVYYLVYAGASGQQLKRLTKSCR